MTNDRNENMGPKNGVFDEALNERENTETVKDGQEVGIGGIKTPIGERTGNEGDQTGLTTGNDMGTASDTGGSNGA